MAGEHVSNDEFFTQLANLFEYNRKKGHGTVYLTQKRVTADDGADAPSSAKVADDPLWDTHPENPLPIVIRANNNKSTKRKGTDREDIPKIKMSTVVQPDQLDAFYARYAEVCKAGMSALKKRDKKKKKKDKKKKKGGEAETKG
ncbi:signal recognition particle 14kD protein-domain-containing protein [Clohesyomyces aquaticus]|uniref:Signal recognition particle subunit SRP14 n=1 Tax=Clohesyomyces aquaticus TaxID=1231657 RepID=A0A1Y1ZTC4_9PLEO|nr:signal recognition particle 14kD protein-domain-containing protein [Clohesyomyces aquaticus]